MSKKYTGEQIRQVTTLADNGMQQVEISRVTGVPLGTLSALIAQGRGEKPLPRKRKPKAYPTLTIAAIGEVKGLISEGRSVPWIARKLGLSKSSVWRVKSGKYDDKARGPAPRKSNERDIKAMFEIMSDMVWINLEKRLDKAVEEAVTRVFLKKGTS
jgi:hypothetical protein